MCVLLHEMSDKYNGTSFWFLRPAIPGQSKNPSVLVTYVKPYQYAEAKRREWIKEVFILFSTNTLPLPTSFHLGHPELTAVSTHLRALK